MPRSPTAALIVQFPTAVAAIIALLPALSQDQPPSRLSFTDVAAESGLSAVTVGNPKVYDYIIDSLGAGVALIDYDLDGDLDVFQVQSSMLGGVPGPPPTHHLYRNEGTGRYTDVTVQAGLAVTEWGFGVAVGDYDNDGDPDMYVTLLGQNRLYRNEGNGTFREVGAEAGVPGRGWGASAAFFDPDRDGDLDLFAANYLDWDISKIPPRNNKERPCIYKNLPGFCGPRGLVGTPDVLYRNNGDGTFTDVSAEAGIVMNAYYYGLGVVTGDLDDDGDSDIYVANDSKPNLLYLNDGTGRFTEEGALAGVAYGGDGREQAGMGIAVGDPDADGDLDLFVTNFSHDYSTLYQNAGGGMFEDASLAAGLVEPTIKDLSWGTAFVDFDHDSDVDLFISNGHVYPDATDEHTGTAFLQRCQVFLNDGTGRFKELREGGGPALAQLASHRAAAFGDVDEDGDVDVVLSRANDTLSLFRNDLPGGTHWASIRLVGTRSNRDAVGARVRLTAGGRTHLLERYGGGSFQAASDPRLHIGLGAAARIDAVEIRWPSGLVERHQNVPIDRTVTFVEKAAEASAPASSPARSGSPR